MIALPLQEYVTRSMAIIIDRLLLELKKTSLLWRIVFKTGRLGI